MGQTADIIQTFKQTSSLVSDVVFEFKKPIQQNLFFINKECLRSNASIIAFSSRWHLRPEYFAVDFYGEPSLFHIILLINDISTRFNFRQTKFNKSGIIAPNLDVIRQVLSQNFS